MCVYYPAEGTLSQHSDGITASSTQKMFVLNLGLHEGGVQIKISRTVTPPVGLMEPQYLHKSDKLQLYINCIKKVQEIISLYKNKQTKKHK